MLQTEGVPGPDEGVDVSPGMFWNGRETGVFTPSENLREACCVNLLSGVVCAEATRVLFWEGWSSVRLLGVTRSCLLASQGRVTGTGRALACLRAPTCLVVGVFPWVPSIGPGPIPLF